MRFFTDCLSHLRRHLQLARNALFLGIHHAARDHQLDDIDLFLLGFCHMCDCFLDTARRNRDRACHVSARHRDSLIRRKDSRSGLLSCLDLIAQLRVKRSDSSDRPDRGHAA